MSASQQSLREGNWRTDTLPSTYTALLSISCLLRIHIPWAVKDLHAHMNSVMTFPFLIQPSPFSESFLLLARFPPFFSLALHLLTRSNFILVCDTKLAKTKKSALLFFFTCRNRTTIDLDLASVHRYLIPCSSSPLYLVLFRSSTSTVHSWRLPPPALQIP